MFRGLRRRLRGNHERRVRHSVFTQLRRVSIPPRAPQLNCSTKKCAIGSHVRLHAPRSLNAPQRPSTLLDTRPALLPRRSASPAENPDTRRRAGRETRPHTRRSARQRTRPPHTAKRPPGDDSRRTLVVPDGPDAVSCPELSCPVSAASAASAPTAPAPAGRPASAGRAAAAGRTPRRTAAAPARARTRAAGPPAVPGPARTTPAAARRGGHESNDDQYDEHRQDDAYDHGATLLPFPRSGPPWALLLACAYVCVCACSSCCLPATYQLLCLLISRVCFLCEGGMPPRFTDQSRVEQLQRVLAGQRPPTCTEAQIRGRPCLTGPSVGRDLAERRAETPRR
ncbi:hypothetical protein FHS35_003879 [Streptomyces umbrinus]|nr:hypothetical protein [Streptomyces umbrinus]